MGNQTNPELNLAFDYVQYTNRNLFLTGKAGTGKTTFLRNLKEQYLKRMIVVAPTGVAAINAGGVTIHSFFQMSFGPQIPNLSSNDNNHSVRRFGRDKINIIKTLDLLIIDEISMVRADVLDGIDEVLRRYKNRTKPFGGVQVLMIGDLKQLAPVIKEDEWELLKLHYDTVFFFSSKALQKTEFVTIELKHIYRQNDERFIHILNKVRENNIDAQTLEELNNRYNPNLKEDEGYITLTTHNYQSQQINKSKLKLILAKEEKYLAKIDGDFQEYLYPTDYELLLKVGAQVMFVKNDISRDKLYYNGKIGVIDSIKDKTIFVKCEGELLIAVDRVDWQNNKYTIDESTKEITESVIGTFNQYPLKLAWAITIHKSQGLTFEKAIIDANSAFAHGQVYVALSRCKSLEGLVLSSKINASSIKMDNSVLSFSQEAEDNQPNQAQLNDSKKAFELELLNELFDFKFFQNRIGYFIKLLTEHKGSINENLITIYVQLSLIISNDFADISEKFKLWIQKRVGDENVLDAESEMQSKIKNASIHFSEKLSLQVMPILENTLIESDNKTVRKQLLDVWTTLISDITIKQHCFNASKNGFNVKTYLEARAKASIEKEAIAKATSNKTEKLSKLQEDISLGDMPHKPLFEKLRKWRNDKAEEMNMPIYIILHQKALSQLAFSLPTSTDELLMIKGFGKTKVQQFGKEVIEIIDAYIKEHGIDIKQKINFNTTKDEAISSTKKDTKQESFELYKQGKSLSEIARIRNLTEGTVETHLIHFMGTGEISINDFMESNKITTIKDYIIQNKTKSLNILKSHFGDKVSYSEIKMVLKYLEFIASNN